MSKSDWSLTDWFHCNSCYKQYSPKGDDPRNKFLFTNCGHIYCAECVDPGNSGNRPCKLCGSRFKTMILSKNIRPDIQQYFQDPKQLIRKGLDILKFQASHQKRLVNYRMNAGKSGTGQSSGNINNSNNMNDNNNITEREMVLRDENVYLKRLLAEKTCGQRSCGGRSPANTAHVSPRQHLANQCPYPPNSGPSTAAPGPSLLSGSVRYHQVQQQVGQQQFNYRKSPYPQGVGVRPQAIPAPSDGHQEAEIRRPPGRLTLLTPPFDAKRGCIVPSPAIDVSRRSSGGSGVPQPMEVQFTPRQSPDSRPRPGYMSVAHQLPSFSPVPSPARISPREQPTSVANRPNVNVSNVVLPFTPGVVRESSLSRYKANAGAANGRS